MKEEQFYTIELSAIEQITIEDIVIGKGTSTKNLEYSAPVPTSRIGLPQQSRDMGFKILQIRGGLIDYGAIESSNSKFEQYRGRLGC